MTNLHGDFVWYELMTPDAEAAAAFYGAVIGWTCAPGADPGVGYREWRMDGVPVGGLLPLTDDMRSGGAHPAWLGYVHVDDLDARLDRLIAAGATCCVGPRDIPGVGRFALIRDPQGVPLYVMTVTSGTKSQAFASDRPRAGHCAWNELSTTAPDAAVAFYTSQFGWRQEGDLDMGALGKYRFLHHGPGMIGAIMPKMPQMPVAMWTFYFRVPDIDRAVATIEAHGGRILQAPIEIPGGEFCLSGADPQGAAFALVGARR